MKRYKKLGLLLIHLNLTHDPVCDSCLRLESVIFLDRQVRMDITISPLSKVSQSRIRNVEVLAAADKCFEQVNWTSIPKEKLCIHLQENCIDGAPVEMPALGRSNE